MPSSPTIRRVTHAKPSGFDEQLWPINVALLILAGMIAGWILAQVPFAAEVWWKSAWTWLATLAVSVGAMMGLAALVGQAVARRYQLAGLFSLAIHVAVMIGLAMQHLSLPKLSIEIEKKNVPIALVEKSPQGTGAAATRANIFISNSGKKEAAAVDLTTQKPVETSSPTPAAIATEIAREHSAVPATDAKPDLLAMTTPNESAALPAQIVKAQAEIATTARRSDTLSELSRHAPAQPKPIPSKAELPNFKAPKASDVPAVNANAKELQRQIAASVATKQPDNGADTGKPVAEPTQVASLTRREQSPKADAAATAASLPTLPKKLNTPGQLPHTDQISADVGAIAATAKATLQPGGATVGKQSSGPLVGKPVANMPLATSPDATPGGIAGPGAPARAGTKDLGPQFASADGARFTRANKPNAPTTNTIALDAAGGNPQSTQGPEGSGGGGNQAAGNLKPAAGAVGRSATAPSGQPGNAEPAGGASTGVENAVASLTGASAALGGFGGGKGKSGSGGSEEGPAAGALTGGPAITLRNRSGTAGGVPDATAEIPTTGEGATNVGRGEPNAKGLEASGIASGKRNSGAAPRGSPNGLATGGAGDSNIPLLGTADGVGSGAGSGIRRAIVGGDGPNDNASTLAGGTGVGIPGRRGNGAQTPGLDIIEQPGLPAGKEGGSGGGGTQLGTGPIQAGEISVARGTAGGVPGAGGGNGQKTSAEPTGPGAGDNLVAAVTSRAGNGGGGEGGPVVESGAGGITRSKNSNPNVNGGNGGSGAETQAEDVQGPSPVAGKGTGEGGLVAVAGGTAKRMATGVPGENLAIPFGAAAGDATTDSIATSAPGAGVVSQRKTDGADGGPSAGELAGGTTVRAIGNKTGIAAASGPIDVPEIDNKNATAVGPGGGSPDGTTGGGTGSIRAGVGPLARKHQSGGIISLNAGPEGAGGLGGDSGNDVGVPLQIARKDSAVASLDPARLPITKKSGAPVSLDARARDSSSAFEGRLDPTGRATPNGGKPGLPGEIETRTESAIELGLKFLIRQQNANGSWSLHAYPNASANDVGSHKADVAATGLVLLAYLGAGYDQFDDKYGRQLNSGIAYLLKNQKPDGDLYVAQDKESSESDWLYSHAIATMALCEALGMTGDEKLREPAQRALDFIVKSQNGERGGWRYRPNNGSDTSVTGWQLTALVSGKFAGLKVPEDAFKKVTAWLDLAQASGNDASQYVYNPLAENYVDSDGTVKNAREGRNPTPVMTSVGLLTRMYLGWDRANPNMIRGADRLKTNLPEIGRGDEKKRDTYYWYYATQVMYHMGGEYWKTWNERLHPLLTESQTKTGELAGSWDPNGPVPDRWAHVGGRLYVTTMNLLSLEVTYRHLPLYETVAK